MKLVACSSCHAQYDITQVGVAEFECRCGTSVRVQELRAVDAAIHRCGACGALVASDATECEYCRSAIVQDKGALSLICPECCARSSEDSRFCTGCGVAFDPQPVPLQGASGDAAYEDQVTELPCPCCGCLMPRQVIGAGAQGVPVFECPNCNGLWVPEDLFDKLVQRAIESRRAQIAQGVPSAPRVSGSVPTMKVEYRKCPVCEALMNRRNFKKRSGVIIDVCGKHGTWLDADELEQITGFILSGGLCEVQVAADEREAAELRREAARAAREVRVASMTGTSGSARGSGENTVWNTVLELFQMVIS